MTQDGLGRSTVAFADFVGVGLDTVRAELDDERVWRDWWPHLRLTPYHRRPDGVRWTVAGELAGTAEWWWEAWTPRPAASRLPTAPDGEPPGGVIVHWYLRVSDTSPGLSRRESARYRQRFWAWRDALECRTRRTSR